MAQSSHTITLNIPHDLPTTGWESMVVVYKAMLGWVGPGPDGCPLWYPDGNTGEAILASVEPSGLVIEGSVALRTWQLWIAEFQRRATEALGFRVHDAEA